MTWRAPGVALALTGVSAEIGSSGFVRRAAVGAFPSKAAPVRTPSASVLAIAGDGPADAAAAAPRPKRASDSQVMMQDQLMRHASADEGVAALLDRLDGAVKAANPSALVDDVMLAVEDLGNRGQWVDLVRILERLHDHHEALADGDARRAFLMGIRRLQRPVLMQGIARLLPERRDLRASCTRVLVQAGEAGADALIDNLISSEVSSERRVETAVARVADIMRRARREGGRIAFVAGPVVVHTGGADYFCELIRLGYVNVLLSGNALAVHDIEVALSGTSLGIDLGSGHPVEHGHRNHMRAINVVRRAGGIARAVESGVLSRGIMHACHTCGVRYILAGSIRDDGPLPETMMDLEAAQDAYAEALDGVEVVVMLASMLHSIGVGNMLPSWVKVISVDINPAVVTKLSDRGSTQTVGIVTDVGLFLHQLATALRA